MANARHFIRKCSGNVHYTVSSERKTLVCKKWGSVPESYRSLTPLTPEVDQSPEKWIRGQKNYLTPRHFNATWKTGN